MLMIQMAKNQYPFFRILNNTLSIVYIIVKFTAHIVHIDLHGLKNVIDKLYNSLDVLTVSPIIFYR